MGITDRSLAILFVISTAIACSPDHSGPLASKPVTILNTESERLQIMTLWDHLTESEIPSRARQMAFEFFDENNRLIQNRDFLTIIDFTRHSGERRFHVIDLNTAEVESFFTAHGEGSDLENTGYARVFSNELETWMTSLGFYLTAENYFGENGLSLRLDGLSPTNSNARRRAIVLHGATYVDPRRPKMGRSQGCPAVEMSVIEKLVLKLRHKSLMFAYVEGM